MAIQRFPYSRLPWVSFILLSLLLGFSPYAMSFGPFIRGASDALHAQRIFIVLFGLFVAVASVIECLGRRAQFKSDKITFATYSAALLACCVIGWRSYPYWTMGVYQVSIGAFPPMDQDPKNLYPMIWIGEAWRVSVVVLHLICYVAIPALVAALAMAIYKRRFLSAITIFACSSVTVMFMIKFSPEYMIWLMD